MNTVDEMVARMKKEAAVNDYYTKIETVCEAFGVYEEERGRVYECKGLIFAHVPNYVEVSRADWRGLFYAGRTTGIHGEPVLGVARYLKWRDWEEVLEEEYEQAVGALENRRVGGLLDRFGELEDDEYDTRRAARLKADHEALIRTLVQR